MIIQILKNYLNYILRRNRPEEMFESFANQDLNQLQVDGYVKKWDDPLITEFFNKSVQKLIEIIKNGNKVLDVGCGTGRYILALYNNFNELKMFGIDISNTILEKYTKMNASSAILKRCDISSQLPFNETFDVIYCITVLQYIPFFKVKCVFKNVYSMLENDGIFYLQFPQGSSIYEMYKSLNYTKYPYKYLESKLKSCGFLIIDSAPLDEDKEKVFGYYIIAKKN